MIGGGEILDTLLTGSTLERAAGFTLKALHYDAHGVEGSDVEQLFAIFDRVSYAQRPST